MKIKITQPGYQGFTGDLGRISFVDSVSVNDFPPREALMLGGLMQIVEVDDEGNELGPVSHAAELVRSRNLATRVLEPLKRGDASAPSPDAAEQNAAKPVVVPAGPQPGEPEAPNPLPTPPKVDGEVKVWSRAELETVADEKGIKGLRDIGTPLGAKNTSIPGLIDDILAAQTQNQTV